MEWELQETTPSSASVEQDLEQQSRDQIVGQEGTVNSPLDLPSLPIPPPLPLWDRHPHRHSWSQNDMNNTRLGIVRSFSLLIFRFICFCGTGSINDFLLVHVINLFVCKLILSLSCNYLYAPNN